MKQEMAERPTSLPVPDVFAQDNVSVDDRRVCQRWWTSRLGSSSRASTYPAPHWGISIKRSTGEWAISSPPPLISETTGPILKIQAAFESPGQTVEKNKF